MAVIGISPNFGMALKPCTDARLQELLAMSFKTFMPAMEQTMFHGVWVPFAKGTKVVI